ncbi:MAG: caspase family protein [Candidatus Sericytochromatia bacterium]|nr:caspase family protein [Candidatus Sericytochromatia bacterium]
MAKWARYTSAFILFLQLSTGCASLLQQGVNKHQSGDLEGAQQLYQEALKTTPNDAAIFNNLAILHMQKQQYRKAIEAYQKALSLAPNEKQYQLNIKEAYKRITKASSDSDLVMQAQIYLKQIENPSQVVVLPTSTPLPQQSQQPPSISPSIPLPSPEALPPPIQTPTKSNTQDSQQEILQEMAKLRKEVQELKQTQSPPPPSQENELDYSQLKEPENIKWALVIGISDYNKEKTGYGSLPYAAQDARKVYDFLISPGGGFKRDNVLLLTDQQATAGEIRKGVHSFLRLNATRENDIVFVYFSGHGELYNRQDAYIVPYGAERSEIVAQGIPLNEINQGISRLGSQKVAFFIDSCHSGSIVQGVNSRGILQNMAGISNSFLNLASKGRLFMTASAAEEEALEVQDKGGLFTHYLLKGLSGEADSSQDQIISVNELFDYIYRNVYRDALKLKNQTQTPQRSGDLSGDLFRLK